MTTGNPAQEIPDPHPLAVKSAPDHRLSGVICIIALKASGRDCTNNNELLHKIGVLQRYAMQLFVFTSEFYKRFDGAVSITVVLKESELTV